VATGVRWIEDNSPALVALAQAIWGFAEDGLQERCSAAAQADFLEHHGFTVQRGAAGMPTALVATYGEGRPCIGFLGEYDALPGLSQQAVPYRAPLKAGANGHGCGHNLLGVGSLAAAVALAKDIAAGQAPGAVRYYGCPAEETADGKVAMARDGLFAELDAAITWYPAWLNTATYAGSLAMNAARFAFHGRAAHASAAPQLGISALDAVELMNVGVNYLREHTPQETRIHYVITDGGAQPNIVPEFASVWYYLRAPRRQDVEEIYRRVVRVAEGAALMTGARLEVKFDGGIYNYLANRVVTSALAGALSEVGGPRFTEEEWTFARELEASYPEGQKAAALRAAEVPAEYHNLVLHEGIAPPFDRGHIHYASTDVADVSWIAPTGQMTTASWSMGAPLHSWQAVALSGMGIGHRGMLLAAKAMALAGLRLATHPELLQQARQTLLEDTEGREYAPVCG
jgi:aminobenzoyl-glutamate utilization protein B